MLRLFPQPGCERASSDGYFNSSTAFMTRASVGVLDEVSVIEHRETVAVETFA